MKRFWFSLALVASVSAQAGVCNFDVQSEVGPLNLSCGMSKSTLLDNIGPPLFENQQLLAAANNASGPGQVVENLVYRLKNRAGTPKMVSLRLREDQVVDIIVSR